MKNWFTSLTMYVDSNNKIFYQRKIQFSVIAHKTCKNTCKNCIQINSHSCYKALQCHNNVRNCSRLFKHQNLLIALFILV